MLKFEIKGIKNITHLVKGTGVCFLLLFLFFITSCKSYEEAGGINWEKSFNSAGFFTQAFVVHTSNDTSQLVIKFLHEVQGVQNEINSRKNVTVSFYTEKGASERIYTADSIKTTIQTIIRSNADTTLQVPFRFLRNQQGAMVIRITSSDSTINTLQFLELDKDKIHQSSFFRVYSSSQQVMSPLFITTADTVHISFFDKEVADCKVEYYKTDMHPANPTFFKTPYPGFPVHPDSVFTYQFNSNINFNKKGFYHFTINNDTIGLNLSVSGPYFPYLKSVMDIIYPLRYITRNEEYNKLAASKNPKMALDSFWISVYKDKEMAKKMIKAYFNRVEYANKYFTTYKPGWMTDQGLIYIFYGKPDRSYKFKDGEIWKYTRHVSQPVEFALVRKESRFGSYLELKRDQDYIISWNQQSFRWRHGTILNE